MSVPLACRDVSVRYEEHGPPTLEGVSFTLQRGERAALVGLNGSGKTSLLLSLVGLVPFSGEISVLGQRLTPRSAARLRGEVGFLFNVPEDQLLFPKVEEDVAFGLLRRGAERSEAFRRGRRMLERMGIGHLAEQPLHHLSHGQMQRVALAGALVTDPGLLLLDEPSAGLDPPAKQELAELLAGLGSTQLVATHDLDFADRLCSRVFLLEGAHLALDVPTSTEVRRRWNVPAPVPGTGSSTEVGGEPPVERYGT